MALQAPVLSPCHVVECLEATPRAPFASGQSCRNQVSLHQSSLTFSPARGVVSGALAVCNNVASETYSLPAGRSASRSISAGERDSTANPPSLKLATPLGISSSPGLANKDEGCWWLMAGFSRPDPPPSHPRSPIPASNLSTSASQRSGDTPRRTVTSLSSASPSSQSESTSEPESNSSPVASSSQSALSSSSNVPQSPPSLTPVKALSSALDSTQNGTGSSGEKVVQGKEKSVSAVKDEPKLGGQPTIPQPLSVAALQMQTKLGSRQLRVAYQGVPGAYSEAAAGKAYPDCEPVPCDQFEAAFQAVELWLVDRAVLPIENSLGGSIHRNYDLLLRHRLHIVGEVQMAVHHCLLGLPGTTIQDLKRVLSHPQALAQCEATLAKLGVTRESVHDTAGAAQMIATEKIGDAGAIASARAAEIYGLDILADGIQDDADNVTRFLILAREPIIPRTDRPWKTSIVFSLEVGPGVLFKALSVFALRDINLTKIESRPQKNRPVWVSDSNSKQNAIIRDAQEKGYHLFDYLFYIDFQASMAEPRAQNALRHLQEFAPFLRVLGSYPMDVSPIAKL